MTGLNVPMTPLRYLERASEVMPAKTAVIDGERRWTYEQFAADVQRLAKGLRASGIGEGDRVAYLSVNSAEMLIAHFGVPLAGGVLVAVNTRLAPEEVAYIREHSGSAMVLAQVELLRPVVDSGVDLGGSTEVDALPAQDGSVPTDSRWIGYGDLLDRGRGEDLPFEVDDEDRTIAINYTSGTTGPPKGVMFTHRGAYLNSLSEIHHAGYDSNTRYLWTLPMFHCNGWCQSWAVTAAMGTHIGLPAVRAEAMWSLIDEHAVTHFSGAPTVVTTLATAPEAHPFREPITITAAGAPPSPTVISRIYELGGEIVHVYGLTETYGPYAVCEPQPHWKTLDDSERAVLMARQGVGMITNDRLRVVRAEPDEDGRLVDVRPDGEEMGEIVMRGNGVMKGYFRDDEGTSAAFAGGWFHSGDLGVMHPDGYVHLLDRAKDVVVSGGENICTIEVEQALLSHPTVVEAAVVGVPDEKWGERPKAFVMVVPGSAVGEAELIEHVESRLAGYKAPREIAIVEDLPKTSTGKLRKNELRDAEWGGAAVRIKG